MNNSTKHQNKQIAHNLKISHADWFLFWQCPSVWVLLCILYTCLNVPKFEWNHIDTISNIRITLSDIYLHVYNAISRGRHISCFLLMILWYLRRVRFLGTFCYQRSLVSEWSLPYWTGKWITSGKIWSGKEWWNVLFDAQGVIEILAMSS